VEEGRLDPVRPQDRECDVVVVPVAVIESDEHPAVPQALRVVDELLRLGQLGELVVLLQGPHLLVELVRRGFDQTWIVRIVPTVRDPVVVEDQQAGASRQPFEHPDDTQPCGQAGGLLPLGLEGSPERQAATV
jgi:hypothetical protein